MDSELKRKPVQISSSSESNVGTTIVALCDDGTIWTKFEDAPWHQVENIPQGPERTYTSIETLEHILGSSTTMHELITDDGIITVLPGDSHRIGIHMAHNMIALDSDEAEVLATMLQTRCKDMPTK